MPELAPKVAIIDYSLGNLFSVRQACVEVGLDGFITSDKAEILAADAVILPGVGAFRDAMTELNRLDLVQPIRDVATSGKPLIGVCLGQQLLMTESFEFGHHKGLNIFQGDVVRFDNPKGPSGSLKVPHVGWNRIAKAAQPWDADVMAGVPEQSRMYFVHSYHIRPANPNVGLTITDYGNIRFYSSVRQNNVVAFQFHPERSGKVGMTIYRNLANWIRGLRS